MKTYLECIPCFFNIVLRTGRLITDDEAMIKKLLDKVGMLLPKITLDSTPPEVGSRIFKIIRDVTGNFDSFVDLKKKNIDEAMKYLPLLIDKAKNSDDPLFTAIKIAIAGNVIDFAPNHKIDIEKEIDDVLNREMTINHYQQFQKKLKEADRIVYIGDNAAESVFDRVLIKNLGKPVTYVVRGLPVINDVTVKDAYYAGIYKDADIYSSQTGAPGAVLKTCNTEFIKMLKNASLVISKGQGNYEALSGEKLPIFFLLKVKCQVIARDIGVEQGSYILKASEHLN